MTIYIDNINRDEKILYARVDDTLTSQDIVDYFSAVDEALESDAQFTEHIDFTATENFDAGYDDHSNFQAIARKVYELNKYTRVICVVKNDQQHGSVRMYASLFRLTDFLEIQRVE